MSVNHRIKNRAGPVTESLPENYKLERFRPRLLYRHAPAIGDGLMAEIPFGSLGRAEDLLPGVWTFSPRNQC